jgi:hypothetical protein
MSKLRFIRAVLKVFIDHFVSISLSYNKSDGMISLLVSTGISKGA